MQLDLTMLCTATLPLALLCAGSLLGDKQKSETTSGRRAPLVTSSGEWAIRRDNSKMMMRSER
jgi:hypothetical protein